MGTFNLRIGNLAVRSDGKQNPPTAEVVEYGVNPSDGKEYCWVLAFLKPVSDGYDVVGVGERILTLFDNPVVAKFLLTNAFKLLADMREEAEMAKENV